MSSVYRGSYANTPEGVAESYNRFNAVEMSSDSEWKTVDDAIDSFKEDFLSKGAVVRDDMSFELAIHDYIYYVLTGDSIGFISPYMYLTRLIP
jgi:hypothetical protein